MGLRADLRAACTTLLSAYASSASVKLQIYPGRPRTINAPCAFIDSITETTNSVGPTSYQRHPVARIVVLHGQFDSKDAAEQADAFVDGFIAYAYTQVHAAGSNTVIDNFSTDDDPNFVSDWQPDADQRTYFATVISVEGFAGY